MLNGDELKPGSGGLLNGVELNSGRGGLEIGEQFNEPDFYSFKGVQTPISTRVGVPPLLSGTSYLIGIISEGGLGPL